MERAEPYSLLARDYDQELGAIFAAFQQPVLEHLLAHDPPPGERVLDLACGTGQVAVYLAERGFAVTGLDRSPAMLAVARRRPGGAGIGWLAGDMTAFELGERFHLITCNFDSVNHLLRVADVRALLAGVHRHLWPGGHFLFDVNTRYALEHLWPQVSRVVEGTDYFAIWRGRFDPVRELALLTADYFLRRADGSYRLLREVHRQRAYELHELRNWLSAAKLHVRLVRSDGAWQEPGNRTGRIALLCEKAG
jgi:SAM-dependent methyltransferase